ncbi:MAG TPA: YkvA family protein, partial [Dermatophilaceae bacterium]|nr:YkvA family protein [Dermatophilaceae bacterium]
SVPRLLAIAAAAGYVVSPVDLLPEGVLGLFGLADDAMVMSWLAAQLVAETEDFLIWEKGAGRFGGRSTGGTAGRGAAPSRAAGQTVPGKVVR